MLLLSLLFRTSYRKSPLALILRILASFVNSKTIHKLLRKDMNHRTSSMATARTETTRGPTYSMATAIWATPWQKGFICRCHCLHATIVHLQWKSLVTWTDISNNGHIDEFVETHPAKRMGVLDPCACSNLTDRA